MLEIIEQQQQQLEAQQAQLKAQQKTLLEQSPGLSAVTDEPLLIPLIALIARNEKQGQEPGQSPLS